MKNIYTKGEVVDYVWQYSRHYGELLQYCDIIVNEISGHAGLINLFNLTEVILKDSIKKYDIEFYKVLRELKEKKYITNIEYNFLNNKKISVRKFRNVFAHSNLSRYNLIFNDEPNILYPLTENSTCIKLYNIYSDIIYNIILKVIAREFIIDINVKLDDLIKEIDIKIREMTPEELLKLKGIDFRENSEWNKLSKDDRYRLADNSGDVSIYAGILKQLLKE
ncbi:hypothetical protein [uncultured Clostridium sp.]|uniref:hypothetical protein n=1 Tax=uncultured Clostridium sp. TaxID=59620 RepID=UPI0025F75280|nr:hypothetical protein [uncultured Clostridium sp.]MDU4883216.1 hypothetical protein [Clostridium celatum]MDU7076946.1 hypothetical protein [Clostridium celatum]